ncbi:hypothetical protein BRADI_1g71325v3 [Brachypodium distachyon]|uniref:Uncharacterized protein n=1 Tax=Brachypodium distachyon TaxID=15368 RepID=A0A2K2DUM5_BRADI|nr:hypothetical protein BRADI_1g71325v3 [Brachypodium distachyon]
MRVQTTYMYMLPVCRAFDDAEAVARRGLDDMVSSSAAAETAERDQLGLGNTVLGGLKRWPVGSGPVRKTRFRQGPALQVCMVSINGPVRHRHHHV